MKKVLSIFVAGLLLLGAGFAVDGDLRDLVDGINDEIPFGYTIDQEISVDQITSSKIIIKSPVIEDELGATIKTYTVIFAPYTLDQMIDTPSLLDEAKEKTFEFTTVGSTVTMELTTSDGISASSVYYVTVIPKDENNILGEASHNEIWFKLSTQQYGEGTYSNATTAAGANMTLANITHTITNNKATLRWTAVAGSDKVDIFLFNPTSNVEERLASVSMSDESYTFTLTRNGEYILRFVPNNGGTQHSYTFVANGITATTTTPSTTTPTIGAIPATGSKENILIALAIAAVVYMVYRRAKAKR